MPVMIELLRDDNAEVKMNVVSGLNEFVGFVGDQIFETVLISTLKNLTMDSQWRVRQTVFKLLVTLSKTYGLEMYNKHLQAIFMTYLTNSAASVRKVGVKGARELADVFKEQWVIKEFVPAVISNF